METTTEIGKLYQDQLYGAKVLSRLAVSIIDSPEFQRLAGLRQLGFSDSVYRGARHTRFEHSVGTYFICRTIMRKIAQNHERLGLEHPGQRVSERFRYFPANANVQDSYTSPQARWRGLTEAVSAAALLHDLGHVPFGHTLEDEFSGIFERHDRLGGPRLYEMLFCESSGLARVFSDTIPPWIERIPNETLRRLIYVVLSWQDDIEGAQGFRAVLARAIKRAADDDARERLAKLRTWYDELSAQGMFHPFMSDIVGNTICADLLDYLPRDRFNLGMDHHLHTRLQRYLTVRRGTLYSDEGLRLSIMVTRKARGGQRRDVATAVLDIMRERYQMAERVFYHHKKAAYSAMLAKLAELSATGKPRDDDAIYPAPWQPVGVPQGDGPHQQDLRPVTPHMTHLSDAELIDYLGRKVEVPPEHRDLQRRLHTALRFRREGVYRTLLVIDDGLANSSPHSISYFATELRGTKEQPSSRGRLELETRLAEAGRTGAGDVIVYCPSPGMQAKEVDARLEIVLGRVLPLRVQKEAFAYQADVELLQRYYEELWRAYIFVSPELFSDAAACQALIDKFCEVYNIPRAAAYAKVRTHDFNLAEGVATQKTLSIIQSFLSTLPFPNVPSPLASRLLELAADDAAFLDAARYGRDARERLSALLEVASIRHRLQNVPLGTSLSKRQRRVLEQHCVELFEGRSGVTRAAARPRQDQTPLPTFDEFCDRLTASILEENPSKQKEPN